MRPHTLTAAKALSSAYLPISAVDRAGVPLRADDRSERRRSGCSATGSRIRGIPSRPPSRCARSGSTRSASSTSTCARLRRSSRRPLGAWPRIRSSATRAASASSARASSCRTRATKAAFDAKLAVGAKCHAALPGARAHRARDRRRHRAVPAVHRDAVGHRRDLREAAPRARRHARVGASASGCVVADSMNALARRAARGRSSPTCSGWVLPVVDDYRGWQAFRVALSPLWPFEQFRIEPGAACSSSASRARSRICCSSCSPRARACAKAAPGQCCGPRPAPRCSICTGRSRWAPRAPRSRERLLHLGLLVRAARVGRVPRPRPARR